MGATGARLQTEEFEANGGTLEDIAVENNWPYLAI
jgi:hypothetical protein